MLKLRKSAILLTSISKEYAIVEHVTENTELKSSCQIDHLQLIHKRP